MSTITILNRYHCDFSNCPSVSLCRTLKPIPPHVFEQDDQSLQFWHPRTSTKNDVFLLCFPFLQSDQMSSPGVHNKVAIGNGYLQIVSKLHRFESVSITGEEFEPQTCLVRMCFLDFVSQSDQEDHEE